MLDQFVDGVRAGEGRALVVRGEPGVGKTVLLEYLARQATGCHLARVAGVQSEMELAFAGLHQLCAPMLQHAELLPEPQRDALRTAFGLAAGPPPDRFLLGLAVLGLLSEAAGEQPLICVVDDEQWLDRASAQALGFAARRLAADPVGVVFAARVSGNELTGLPELLVEGLAEGDARELLVSVLSGPPDALVREQIIADTHGNPLALLELPRGLTPAQLAGGFGLPGAGSLDGRIEDSFGRQLQALPAATRRLMQLAAWRGREQEASELTQAIVRDASARDQRFVIAFAHCAAAVLYNGLGRYLDAREAGRQAWQRQPVALGVFAVPELAEAATRSGDLPLARDALAWLSERTQVAPTEWTLGIEARVRALLSTGADADRCYIESIEHLARTSVRAQLARSHLLYGEWLRQENRRLDARAQLRAAHDMLSDMEAEAFAKRARRELLAAGETVRRRTVQKAGELTDQEAHIARLAVDGRTNSEIGTQLFLSARTVEWHLRKVYTKLGVGSRRELRWAMASLGQAEPQNPQA